jgi:hypothetical protein
VDSSILQLDFGHGFKPLAMSVEEAKSFLEFLEGPSSDQLLVRLQLLYKCVNPDEQKIYMINNTRTIASNEDAKILVERLNERFVQSDDGSSHSYLSAQLSLMRLFKNGNILIPIYYFYELKDGRSNILYSAERTSLIFDEPYRLETGEHEKLERFLDNTRLPFTNPILQLAFECFELSYETPDLNLAYLALISGLEALLNPGYQELRNTISRNAAVLLGETREQSDSIYADVKELYDKRSRILHQGELTTVKKEDLSKLRHYVRETIKEMHKSGMSKKEILALLNSHGFGEKTSLVSLGDNPSSG